MLRGSFARQRLTSLCAVLGIAVFTTATAVPNRADACGCLSPPEPQTVSSDDYAVNQQSEQIIFEVPGDGTITAHVLIRYAGAPEQFAWVVPVPSPPQLDLSQGVAFGLLDEQTRPLVSVLTDGLCPSPEYSCEFHDPPQCGQSGSSDTNAGDDGGSAGGEDGAGTSGGDEPPGGVDVIDREVIGSYETVTFSATDSALAVQWLQDNGFIVNDTMTPFMQPYIDAGMVFVAARLVAGAGIDEIRPLKMTYQAENPMVPLQLTAVAAEPHLTVTSYIYGSSPYEPQDRPLAGILDEWISQDDNGRLNYPMVAARAIDEVGGDGFIMEYQGVPAVANFDDGSGCCDEGDFCGIGFDGACQCPASEFDVDDCSQIDGLVESVALLEDLATRYPQLTRLTTRISAEEMSFDPVFRPMVGATPPVQGRLLLSGRRKSLENCEPDIIDRSRYDEIIAQQQCSTLYCGSGQCVVTGDGPACACDSGYVARSFTDVDGEPSVTCVPEVGPVDLGADTVLPDACLGFDCGMGTCIDLGGFPACQCDAGAAGALTAGGGQAACRTITSRTESSGARNFTDTLADVRVCSPAPPTCGNRGWLVPNDNKQIQGELCAHSVPSPDQLQIPPAPTCDDLDSSGGGGQDGGNDGGGFGEGGGCACTADSGNGLGWFAFGLFGLAGWRLRRRRR